MYFLSQFGDKCRFTISNYKIHRASSIFFPKACMNTVLAPFV